MSKLNFNVVEADEGATKSVSFGPNSPLKRLFQMVVIKRECYVNDLWELVGHETVSTRNEKREDIRKSVDWLLKRLADLDVVAFGEHLGMQITESYQTIRMPRVIIGVLVHSPSKPTILVYGNLDVEEAVVSDGWGTDPFVMTEIGEYLYGRGVAMDKGPLLCWLNAIQAYRDAGLRLPVNLVFVIESMAHCGSLGLETVLKERISFFRNVSCVAMATRRWQSATTPGVVYGSRGLIYYHLEVQCCNRDLSSFEHGGTIFEALPDLFYLLSSLADPQLNILIDGAMHAHPVDLNAVRCADFDYAEFGENLKVPRLPNRKKKHVALAENWAMPHLSIHGIEGANSEADVRFVIPHKVTGKFSISLAPNQRPEDVTKALQKHLGVVWLQRASPNKMMLCEKFVIPSWSGRCNSPEYLAATRAMGKTYNVKPNFIRDGGSLLAPSIFQRVLDKNVVVLPIAEHDIGGCPVNERISVDNYIKGSQLLAAFMWEYAQEKPEGDSVHGMCMPNDG
ncbi:cytosolic non-specific dipeptidase-like [Drosophila subobscura]|uniref:cytosolic non-specific dipeptidase-like n=1 Tax=Drosophila subobscura TaxID=7241 RepID=UPI00155A1F08|nr:cytosolic non-specific dipeptidase-like [Drosophila subobscura]